MEFNPITHNDNPEHAPGQNSFELDIETDRHASLEKMKSNLRPNKTKILCFDL